MKLFRSGLSYLAKQLAYQLLGGNLASSGGFSFGFEAFDA